MPKANKRRAILTALLAALIAVLIIFGVFSLDSAENDLAVSYIEGLGWQVEHRPSEISYITVPQDFDIVFQTYNALQTESGFDLLPYRGQRLIRYSYRVLNHAQGGEGEIRANVFLLRGQIVAADISSLKTGGFMHPITDAARQSGR